MPETDPVIIAARRSPIADVVLGEYMGPGGHPASVAAGEHGSGLDATDPRACSEGGTLALGHPWGASDAVGVVRLFNRPVRSGYDAGTWGLAAASVGGLGVAALFEVVR